MNDEREKIVEEMRAGLRKLAGKNWLVYLSPERVDAMFEEELIMVAHRAFKEALKTWEDIIKWLQPACEECLRLMVGWYDNLPQEYKDAVTEYQLKKEG